MGVRFDWIKFLQFQNMAEPLWETIYMVFVSTIIALIIGLPIGILLVTSDEKGVKPNKTIHKILDMIIVNYKVNTIYNSDGFINTAFKNTCK